MLNIPEKLLRALGFLKDEEKGVSAQTVHAKALLNMMRDIHKNVAEPDEEEEEEREKNVFIYEPNIQYSSYYNQREELGLSAKDLRFLDEVSTSKSTFNQIYACHKEIIRLTAAVSRRWREAVEQDDNWGNWYSYIDDFGGWVARKEYNFRKGSWNYNSCVHKSKTWLFSHIFQLCENEVRAQYLFGRALSLNRPYKSTKVLERVEEIVAQISLYIDEAKHLVKPTTDGLEIELNKVNASRWKVRFAQLCEQFGGESSDWASRILDLYKQNKDTNNRHYIFFQASQFLADKAGQGAWAVKMYAYYGYCLATEEKPKKWTQKQQKSVFSRESLMTFYKSRVENLAFKMVKQSTFFAEIDSIFEAAFAPPKRKKIAIDFEAVAETKAAHSETVAILNEILSEDAEDAPLEKIVEKIAETPKKEKAKSKNIEKNAGHNFLPSLGLNAAQTALLAAFEANNLQLNMAEIRVIAQTHLVPANALIDSINEACFELLDDVLIEENEADVYQILADYFAVVVTKT
jgi:hypothetical protein